MKKEKMMKDIEYNMMMTIMFLIMKWLKRKV